MSRLAAPFILGHREQISATWRSLLDPGDGTPNVADLDVVTRLCDLSLVAFSSYLESDNFGRVALAREWRRLNPTPALVAGTTAAMSMFVEALRRSWDRLPDAPVPFEPIAPAAAGFVGDVVTAVLQSINLEYDDLAWEAVSRELDEQHRQRVARLDVLADIARAVSTATSVDDLFEKVRGLCERVFQVRHFLISLLDGETRCATPHLFYVDGVRRRDLEGRSLRADPCLLATERGEPVSAVDYASACAEHGLDVLLPIDAGERLAWMAAPIGPLGQTTGVIAVLSDRAPFDAEDLELLGAIARQTAVALENSRLIEAERRRARQLKAVNLLARHIVTLGDSEHLLERAVNWTHDLFGYSFVSLFLLDRDGSRMVLKAHSPLPNGQTGVELSIPVGSRSIVADAVSAGQPILVGDVSTSPRYLARPEVPDTRSELAVPIHLDGRVLGVLDVQSPDPFAFDDHDVTTLATIADQMAIALENVRLLTEERERSAALSLMLSTTRAAGSSLILDDVLQRLAEGISEAAGGLDCAIYLLDEGGQTLSPAAAVVVPVSALDRNALRQPLVTADSPVLRRVLLRQETMVSNRTPSPEDIDAGLAVIRGAAPTLVVPLVARGIVLGVALVIAARGDEMFASPRVRLIQGVADSAALAIENARLYARSQGLAIAEERGRIARDIHDGLAQGLTAISLQLDLADTHLPARPDKAALHVRRALEVTRRNLEEARRSVLDLRAAHLHEVPLPAALRRLVQAFAAESGVDAVFETEGIAGRLSARVEMGLYRIAEEALDNIRQHAGAARVRVALHGRDHEVRLIVQDDGVGFEMARAVGGDQPRAGFGLVGIRERARLLCGTLTVQSAPGSGTKLEIVIPFEAGLVSRPHDEESRP